MITVALFSLGRFGNQLFRWAYAKAFCEQNGYELHTQEWIGERIFTLDGYKAQRPTGREDIVIEEYRQMQKDMIYTRDDCRRWFAFSEFAEMFCGALMSGTDNYAIAHLRRGDYAGAGYPVIAVKAYMVAARQFGIDPERLVFIGDERPWGTSSDNMISFLPDFYRMTKAENLFRANSTFSWWAAVLGRGNVFSPVINGLPGGVEHENVTFVSGNHPRCADLGIVTDLFLEEK